MYIQKKKNTFFFNTIKINKLKIKNCKYLKK